MAAGAGWTMFKQLGPDQGCDTGRFLGAGALESLLVLSQRQALPDACSALLRHLAKSEKAIVESSSALTLLRPACSLLVIDPGSRDFKASAREQLANFNVLVARKGRRGASARSAEMARSMPSFPSRLHGLDPDLTCLLRAVLVG